MRFFLQFSSGIKDFKNFLNIKLFFIFHFLSECSIDVSHFVLRRIGNLSSVIHSHVGFSFQQEIDGKRDQFRKYIESKGVIDGITKVLTKLLEAPEKPEHPMDFIRANLGASQAEEMRIASLEKEVDDYKKEVSELKSQLEAVKTKLSEYEKTTDAVEADDTKKEEQLEESVQATEEKETDKKAASVGGAEVDAIKDKNVAESEKAATASSIAATVDSAKVSNDSETADVAKSNTTDTKKDGEKLTASTTSDADNAKKDENDTTTANSTDKDK